MTSRNAKGYPPRLCAICHVKVRFQDRLCPEHVEEYKKELVFNPKNGSWRPGELTSGWLSGIIDYDTYSYRVELRDVGKVEPLDKVAGRI